MPALSWRSRAFSTMARTRPGCSRRSASRTYRDWYQSPVRREGLRAQQRELGVIRRLLETLGGRIRGHLGLARGELRARQGGKALGSSRQQGREVLSSGSSEGAEPASMIIRESSAAAGENAENASALPSNWTRGPRREGLTLRCSRSAWKKGGRGDAGQQRRRLREIRPQVPTRRSPPRADRGAARAGAILDRNGLVTRAALPREPGAVARKTQTRGYNPAAALRPTMPAPAAAVGAQSVRGGGQPDALDQGRREWPPR